MFALREVAPDFESAIGACPSCGTIIGAAPMEGTVFRSPTDIYTALAYLGALEREELHVVIANAKNRIMAVERVYVGNVSASLVRIAELFTAAIRRGAASIVLAHNHPSGDATPSPDDLHLTAEAIAAGRLLDLPVLDHIVIGRGTYTSLRDRGVAFDRR